MVLFPGLMIILACVGLFLIATLRERSESLVTPRGRHLYADLLGLFVHNCGLLSMLSRTQLRTVTVPARVRAGYRPTRHSSPPSLHA